MVTRSEPRYSWDFCGGHAAIDFTNTVGSRGGHPKEHLNVYADLISWAETRGIIGRRAADRLRREAADRPAAAAEALQAALSLREALYRAIGAASSKQSPSRADLALITAHLRAAYARAELAPRDGRLALSFDTDEASLQAPILTPIVQAAADLLTGGAIDRVRSCADESCAWLFLDATRSGTRRWCDMKVCGNRHKVKRFRVRTPARK
jgi:predicted RNA-binding Zn ribbon-like protein